jgi:tetratricopeptide (TPR) repeat protein
LTLNIERAKDRARKHELREQWDKAIEIYDKIIVDLERRSEIDSDLALYNKLGDLYLKAGKISSAVEIYEKAVSRYAESGFPNNAIALCNKVLRNAPGRTPMYLKLAKLMLERGFTSEAKRNLLEYAERMQRTGQLEEAFNALKDFADLSPDNEEIRLLLAEQLQAAARTDEAREQLSKLYAEVEAHGDRRAMRATLDKMRVIDPEYDVEAAPKPPVERRQKASDLIFLDLGDEPAVPARPIYEPPPPAPEPEPEPALPLIDITEADAAPEPALETTSLAEEAAQAPTPAEPLEYEPTALAEAEAEGVDVERISTHFAPPDEGVAAVDGLAVEREFEAPAESDVPSLEIEPTALEQPLETAPPEDEVPAEGEAPAQEEMPVEEEAPAAAEAEAKPAPTVWEVDEESAEGVEGALEEAIDAVEAETAAPEVVEVEAEFVAEPEAEPVEAAAVETVEPVAEEPLEVAAEEMVESVAEEPVEAAAEEMVVPVAEEPVEVAAEDLVLPVAEEPVEAEVAAEAEIVEAEPEPEPAAVAEEEVEDLVVEFEEPPLTLEPLEAGNGAELGVEVDGAVWDEEEVGALEVPEIDLSGIDGEAAEALADVPSLALVEEPPAGVTPPPASVEDLESGVASDPENADLHRTLAEALIEAGERERGLEELEITLRLHEGAESWGAADGVVREILRLEPNSVRYHQKRVELAFHQGDKSELADAYLGLADALLREGATERARAVYQRVLEHDPLNERAQLGLATLEPEAEAEEEAGEGVVQKSPLDAEFIDLGALILEDEDLRERDTRMRIEEEEPTGDEQRDFEEMLSEFKRGIEANLADEDWQAHYDLGIAFKEMGLLDEAITEFQKALRSPEGRLRTAEALGSCFYERGQYAVAATVLRRAVEADTEGDDDKIGLLYWLGRCEEQLGRRGDALTHYQRVFSIDINFQDVSQRVTDLAEAGS